MAAISLSIKRGVDGFKITDFTVGTLAPGANDFELRFNTTDANAKAVTMLDVKKAIEAFIRATQTTDSTVNIITIPTL
jgi:hypothetical protein